MHVFMFTYVVLMIKGQSDTILTQTGKRLEVSLKGLCRDGTQNHAHTHSDTGSEHPFSGNCCCAALCCLGWFRS